MHAEYKQLGALLLILALAQIGDCSNYTVIVIGAGAAGTAAATRLLENNITDILVLEAESRIGGRIFTKHFGEAYVEMGAQWCHGRKENAVYQMVEKYDLIEEDDFDPILFYSNGEELKKQDNADMFELLMNNDYADNFSNAIDNNDGMDIYLTKYKDDVKRIFKDDPAKLNLALAATHFLENQIRSYEGVFNLSNLAANPHYVQPELMNFAWKHTGYKIIFDILTKKFPKTSRSLPFEEKLLLNKEVSKITWDREGMVSVEGSDGTKYLAKHVIFTPSVGVLKNVGEKLFEPELPESKKQAIEATGLDAVMKIHLHFEEKWWNFEGGWFGLIWSLEDYEYLAKNESLAWILDAAGFTYSRSNEKVLTTWMTGEKIPQVEALSNEQVSAAMHYMLQKFFGKTFNVTKLTAVLKTDWYSNPHFRGTYSYETLKARDMEPPANVRLSEPLRNKQGNLALLFAGEATHPIYYSTVHGAIETGWREADRIIAHYKL